MSYAGLRMLHPTDEMAGLGGNVLEGDPYTFSPAVWRYVIDRFAVETVLDLGCGRGYSAAFFHRCGLRVLAVDGLDENVEQAVHPVLKVDLTLMRVTCRVDLVHCQEVVEHINEAHLENLLSSLVTGKFILMTHALPGQGGHHHVNEQPDEYWIAHMARRGCNLLEEDTRRIRAIAEAEGAKYLKRSALMFANTERV